MGFGSLGELQTETVV